MKELHAQHGSVVHIAPNEVSVIDEHARVMIYTTQHGPLLPKDPYWFQPRPNGSYGMIACPNSEYGRFQRTFTPAFTEKATREQDPLILRLTDLLMKQLSKEASKDHQALVNITE